MAFAQVPDEVFLNLREGECLIAAYQSSGQAQVYLVRIRPTVTYVGEGKDGEKSGATGG